MGKYRWEGISEDDSKRDVILSAAKNPYNDMDHGRILGILRRQVYPELVLSLSKGEAEGLLRMTLFARAAFQGSFVAELVLSLS